MKRRLLYIFLMLSALVAVNGIAYGANQKKKVAKAGYTVQVVAGDGSPVEYAAISSSQNRQTYISDEEGRLSGLFKRTDILKASAAGFIEKTIELAKVTGNEVRVTLESCPVYEDSEHVLYTVDGGSMSELRSVGNYSIVKGQELEQYPSLSLMDGLSGRLNGLFYRKNSTVPAGNSWSGFVRASNGGTPVIMVDGVVRSMDYIEPETVETVEILKDASLKALYGGVRTNAIIMITTKRGKSYENGVRVNVQSGVEMPTVMPEYLNSRDYTTAYNQAMTNSGMTPFYDPSKYDGTKPLQYPDVDFHDYFLKKFMTINRVNAQMTGGSRNTRYFMNLGFQDEKGLEKFTSYPQGDRSFTVRGNIDNTIFDFITMKVGINAALQTRSWNNTSGDSFMDILSNIRPNEFPVQIPGSMVGRDEEYVLGGIPTRMNNPLGLLTKNGYSERVFSYIQSDFTMKFDFDKWIKGFSIVPAVTFDIYNMYSSKKTGGFSVYQPTAFDEDGNVTAATNWGYDSVVTSLSTGDVAGKRSWHFRTTANYDRSFGQDHKLKAVLMYFMQQQNFNSAIHSVRRINLAAQVNYMYGDRYVIDASANYVGVPSFAKNKRFGVFPTIGLGWIISNENLMDNAGWVNYLKLHASYGKLGSTNYNANGIVANYYYKTLYGIGSSYGQFTSFNNIVNAQQIGNPDITFQVSREWNAGIDFAFLNNALHGTVGGFLNNFSGGIANMSDITPGVVGKASALMYDNLKGTRSYGVEAELSYEKRFGDFILEAGGNITYAKSKITKDCDIDYPSELAGLKKIVFDGDVKGYRVAGIFEDQAQINASPVQPFGGKVYAGDLRYEDRNADGVVDEADMKVIANTTPSIQYGINIGLRYKGLNISILGYGLAGFDAMLTNKYYQIYGGRKYSEVINKGLPNGNPHPMLHADDTNNNFQNSDYWVANGGFFKIRNVELGYTLPLNLTSKIRINSVKFFVRGSNLCTFSQIKDLDPEYLDAGVSNYPLMRAFTGGLSFSF